MGKWSTDRRIAAAVKRENKKIAAKLPLFFEAAKTNAQEQAVRLARIDEMASAKGKEMRDRDLAAMEENKRHLEWLKENFPESPLPERIKTATGWSDYLLRPGPQANAISNEIRRFFFERKLWVPRQFCPLRGHLDEYVTKRCTDCFYASMWCAPPGAFKPKSKPQQQTFF